MKYFKIFSLLIVSFFVGTFAFAQQQQLQPIDPETMKKEMREVERMAKKNPNALALLAAITPDKAKSEKYWKDAATKKQPEALYRQFLSQNPACEALAIDSKATAGATGTLPEIKEIELLREAATKKYAPAMFLLARIYGLKRIGGTEFLPLFYGALETALTVYGIDMEYRYLMEFSAAFAEVEKLKKQAAEAPAEIKTEDVNPDMKWALEVIESYEKVKKLTDAPTATGYWFQANLKSPGTPLESHFANRSISKGNVWATALQYLSLQQAGGVDEKISNKYKRIFDKNPNVRGDIAAFPRNFSASLTNDSQVLNYNKSENKFNKKFSIETAVPTQFRKIIWEYNLRMYAR